MIQDIRSEKKFFKGISDDITSYKQEAVSDTAS